MCNLIKICFQLHLYFIYCGQYFNLRVLVLIQWYAVFKSNWIAGQKCLNLSSLDIKKCCLRVAEVLKSFLKGRILILKLPFISAVSIKKQKKAPVKNTKIISSFERARFLKYFLPSETQRLSVALTFFLQVLNIWIIEHTLNWNTYLKVNNFVKAEKLYRGSVAVGFL